MPPWPSRRSIRYRVPARSGRSATSLRWRTTSSLSTGPQRLSGSHLPSRRLLWFGAQKEARLAAEFLVAGGQLPQRLEQNAAEFAPRERQVVGHVGRLEPELRRQGRVGRPSAARVVEIVALEQAEVDLLAARRAVGAQSLNRQTEQAPDPLSVEGLLGIPARRRRLDLGLGPLEIERQEGPAPAALQALFRLVLVAQETIETGAQEGAETALLLVIGVEEILLHGAHEEGLRQLLR